MTTCLTQFTAQQDPVTYSLTTYKPPNVTDLIQSGSTARIWRHSTRPGIVIKSPLKRCWESIEPEELSLQCKFRNEMQILGIVGEHPRVVTFLGPLDSSEPARGLLFKEAPNGDVQQFLNTHGDSIDSAQRLEWCKEVAEGLSYCHGKGVLHCDLRPDNLLIDSNLKLQICDFGGSVCGELDGGGLPDYGFFDPRDEDIFTVTESMEVFGLSSIIYSVMTGHRPHGPSIFETTDEIIAYGEGFECLIRNGNFPDTKTIKDGNIICDCWTKKVPSAKDAWARLIALEKLQ